MEDFRFAGVVDMLVLCVAKVQKLADLSTTANLRLIDGILLTKFDTIDDKVLCACVSLSLNSVYSQGIILLMLREKRLQTMMIGS
jgi:hypothetical protein